MPMNREAKNKYNKKYYQENKEKFNKQYYNDKGEYVMRQRRNSSGNKYHLGISDMASFKLPTMLKDELLEYCAVNDRTQSQVMREALVLLLKKKTKEINNGSK